MKKFLLSLAAVALCSSAAMADTAYFYATASAPTGADESNSFQLTGTVADNSYSAGNVTISFVKVNGTASTVNSNLVRWYANDKITITGKGSQKIKISAVKITASSNSYAKPVTVSEPSDLSVTINNTIASITCSDLNTITLSNTAQVRFSVLEVTYTNDAIEAQTYNPAFEDAYTIYENEEFPLNIAEGGPAITYTTSDKDVAYVDEDTNMIWGMGVGTATITATWGDDVEWAKGSKDFTVEVKAERIKTDLVWDFDTLEVNKGDEYEAPRLIVDPEEAESLVVYTSSNKAVATINDGVLKIEGRGTATITAEIEESDLYKGSSASYTLKVVDPTAMDVTFDFVNGDYGFSLKNTDGQGTDETYETSLKSISEGIATIDFGKDIKYRLWKTSDSRELRINGKQDNIFTISLPNNYIITEVDCTGTSSTLASSGVTISSSKWIAPENNNSSSYTFSCSTALKLKTITVKFAKKPKKQELVLDLSADNYDLTGHTESWLDEAGVTNVIYYVPECDETFTLQTKSVAELTEDADTNWEIYLLTEPENKEALEMIFDGGWCMFTPSEAGVYGVDFYVPATENYDFTAATGVQRIHVYPHADNHFKYEPQDLENCMYEDGMFRLNRHDETNPDKAYTYHFKRVMMAEAEATKMRAPQHEGFEEYDHEAGIDINGVKELQFIAEKNGVKSLNPAVINVSEISTGVATIAAEDSEAVYFDLQGRRLQGAPTQGIYLVRTGNKVEKAVK